MTPRLIAIDMDGTLLDSDGQVSARNLAALRAAEAAGVEIVVATGRRHCYAMRVLRDLNFDPASALVSSNGTVIRTIGAELLHRSHLSIDNTRWLCQHLDDFRSTMMLTFDMVGPTGEDTRGALVCEHLEDLNTSIDRWMRANEPYIRKVERIEDSLHGAAPIQMMLCGPVARMAEAEARLLEDPLVIAVGDDHRNGAEIALHRTIYPEKDLSIVDILPAGSSKATALQYLAGLRGISTDEIVAIGDNWNDLPMLRLAGHAVLMANAPDDLRAIAHRNGWTIAASNDEDGVALAIEEVLEGSLARFGR
jgi:hydroxymethylpyrimidine pyrophosphatase-like HAD family hydrolase